MNQHPIALVTGGSRGIGRATALALAERGSDVLITYLSNEAAAREVVDAVEQRGRRAAALRLDIADGASFDAFTRDLRSRLEGWRRARIDHVVNNAGTPTFGPLADTTEAQLDAAIAANFRGPLLLTAKLLPLVADGGRIVFVSTGVTRYAPTSNIHCP